MRLQRYSIGSLLMLIAIVAVGLAALRSPSPLWASTTYTVAAVVLIGAVSNAILGKGARRAYWLGFSLFGGAYDGFLARFSSVSFRQIGHSLAALFAATLGGVFVRWRYQKNSIELESPEAKPGIDAPGAHVNVSASARPCRQGFMAPLLGSKRRFAEGPPPGTLGGDLTGPIRIVSIETKLPARSDRHADVPADQGMMLNDGGHAIAPGISAGPDASGGAVSAS